MKKALIIIIITIVILVGFSCVCIFSIPFMFFINSLSRALIPPPNLKRYVTQDELIGVWILNSYTENIIARDKPSGTRPVKCHLTLNKDGTCEFDSVYGSYDYFTYRKSSGKWSLEHNTKGRKKNTITLDMKSPGFSVNMHLYLKKKYGKLILWEWYGDPDSREFIEYVKEESNSKND